MENEQKTTRDDGKKPRKKLSEIALTSFPVEGAFNAVPTEKK